ncbi:hypothetical protein HS096_04260 [candidate division WWE3 bacterium]|uniref:Uncharacterized protein n=1 Tax=candidate division WWE3 bacterium TaxID=2053526 RepID=A0A928TXH5_UNCKA|nr:hypothetical protein [candidate division WWE3 bacterium]
MKRRRVGRRKPSHVIPTPNGRWNRAHYQLMGLFGVAAFGLLVLNIALIATDIPPAQATASENVEGWAWSSTGGWLSMNNTNAGAGGGSYGVHIDPVTKMMTGYAWSDNQGWVCFGSSCAGTTPAGGAYSASVDGSNRVRGWAQFLNLGSPDGAISLNCLDTGGGGSCGTSSYGPTINFASNPATFSGFAWHGATGSGIGWGWIDFSFVTMNSQSEGTTIPSCHDGIDNDLDGAIDCADNACYQNEALLCPAFETNCGLIGHSNCCSDGDDDDNDGAIDCADTDCSGQPVCMPENCTDGIDNNLDGNIDCADPQCTFAPACTPEICDNSFDDDGDGALDCDDSDCFGAPACTPAWLQSQYGNVYSQLGVEGNAPPAGTSFATYCITSGGLIHPDFSSATLCKEESVSQILDLPTGGSGYVSNLGRLDVDGILSGRYGPVVLIANDSGITNPMNGRIYLYDGDTQGCSAPFQLGAKIFQNASGPNARGNGLLVVKGCNLQITGDLSYQPTGVSQYLRNLASFGMLVLAKYSGGSPVSGTGEVLISPGVGQVVGTIYAERSIRTGSTGSPATDIQLKVYGALVSREIRLERQYSDPTQAAEDVIFDGRAVVNPPPGFQDISKSLPSLSDTF